MKALIAVLITLTLSIAAQASIPDRHPGVIYETNVLEGSLKPGILY